MNALLFNIVDGKSMTSTQFSSNSYAREAQEDAWTEIPRELQKIKDFSYRGQMRSICQHRLQLVPAQTLSYQLGHRCTQDGCALRSAGTTHEGGSGKAFSCATPITTQVIPVKPTLVINKVRWLVWLLTHSWDRIHSLSMQSKIWWLKFWAPNSAWNVLSPKKDPSAGTDSG